MCDSCKFVCRSTTVKVRNSSNPAFSVEVNSDLDGYLTPCDRNRRRRCHCAINFQTYSGRHRRIECTPTERTRIALEQRLIRRRTFAAIGNVRNRSTGVHEPKIWSRRGQEACLELEEDPQQEYVPCQDGAVCAVSSLVVIRAWAESTCLKTSKAGIVEAWI